MVARTQKEIRQRAPWWLIGLLISFFVLMTYDAHQDGDATKQRMIRVWAQAIVAPVQRVTSGVGGAGLGFFQRVANLRHAASENEQLKHRVEEMQVELRETRDARDENKRLKGLLEIKEKRQYATVIGAVIARDPSEWFDTVTINAGTMSGVALNMPVVTAEGIVGRIVATSPWTAQVMLITDEKAAAGAVVGQLGQAEAFGSIKGLGENNLLEMRYVSGLVEIKPGDYVTTTGQDGIYPAGLSVGEVVKVARPGSATVPHVLHVKASAKLDSLREVAVLLYRPPQRTEFEQSLPNVDKGKK
jgi:rod shape-determining protein MreC